MESHQRSFHTMLIFIFSDISLVSFVGDMFDVSFVVGWHCSLPINVMWFGEIVGGGAIRVGGWRGKCSIWCWCLWSGKIVKENATLWSLSLCLPSLWSHIFIFFVSSFFFCGFVIDLNLWSTDKHHGFQQSLHAWETV